MAQTIESMSRGNASEICLAAVRTKHPWRRRSDELDAMRSVPSVTDLLRRSGRGAGTLSGRRARARRPPGDSRSDVTQLVLENQSMVYNLAYRLLGVQELALAATEVALARAFSTCPRRREPGPLWLVRLAVGCCQEELCRLTQVCARSTSIEVREQWKAPISLSSEPQRTLDEVQDLLDAIPVDQRIAVVLADLFGLSYREIAGVTGFSARTASRNLCLGRSALRDGLVKRGMLASSAQGGD